MDFSSFFQYPDAETENDKRDVILLPQWTPDKWEKLLAHTETRRFSANEEVIAPGEIDRSLYIIVEGSLEVLIPRARSRKMRTLAVVEAGSIIGEQAFLDGKPRSASVRAVTPGTMLRLNLDGFEVFAARYADLARDLLFDLGRILSVRLRQTESVISAWGG